MQDFKTTTFQITLEHNGGAIFDETLGRELDDYVSNMLAENVCEDALWESRDLSENEKEEYAEEFDIRNVVTRIAPAQESAS